MGNINNCLINNIRFDEIKVKQGKNNEKDKQFKNKNPNNIIQRVDFNNENKLEEINEEKNMNKEKSNLRHTNEINVINNTNKNINFNNIKFNNGIIIDNNVLFNSTRKSNHMKKKFETYQPKINNFAYLVKNKNNKNNIPQDNINMSENNLTSNKVVNTEEDSDNLIVIDYNSNLEKINNENNNLNVNSINGYNNNDGFINNIKKLNEINDEKKVDNIINNLIDKNKNLIQIDNNITFNQNYNINSPNKESENKNDINELTQKSDKTLKNEFIETTNIFKKSIPYSKPKLNLYVNDNIQESNKKIGTNNFKQILINKNNEEQDKNDKYNDVFFISKNKEENLESKEINKNNNENNINNESNFISNVRKINPDTEKNDIEVKENYNNIINDEEKDNNENYDNINYINEENIISNNINNKNKNNFKKKIILQKEKNNIKIKKLPETNNNIEDQNIIDGGILYQTATMNNVQENITKNINNGFDNSNSLFNSQDLNEDINSPILQNKDKYFSSNKDPNEINQIYNNKDYFYPQNMNNIDNEDIDELQHKLITQLEPRDKDSELEATPRINNNNNIDNIDLLNKEPKNDINNHKYINSLNEDLDSGNKDTKNNINIYQKKNFQKVNIKKIIDQNDQIIDNEEINSKNKENLLDNLITPLKNQNKIYKKKYINDTSSPKTEIKKKELAYATKTEKDEDFADFKWDDWKKFYPEDDRFFKFPKEGLIHGQEIQNEETGEIYQGDLNKNGEKHGHGKYISTNLKRIGMWRRNIFTGWGKEIRSNGDIYEGKFINEKLNGKGFYKNKIKNISYIGDFIDSQKHGKGELFTKEYHYKGDFNNNKFEGYGKIELYNEGEYEGTFKDGLFDGKGMLRWKDGTFYKGELSKGKQDGYGEETSSNGNVYKGYFSKGNKNGEGKFITADGNTYNCFFKDGKAVKNVDNN